MAALTRPISLERLNSALLAPWVLGETLLFMFHAFILQFARLFAKVHAKLVQPKSQIYVARYAPKPGVLHTQRFTAFAAQLQEGAHCRSA